jgi:hypothetical protein
MSNMRPGELDMQDRVAALERRLAALEDQRAIKELKYRYLRACDRKRPLDVLDCLDPDGAVIAYEGFPRFETREAFVQIFEQMGCKPTIIDMHHGENPEIIITGSNSAAGTWDLFFQSIDTEAATVLQMGCEYTDVYTRKYGRWWISATATKRTSFMLQKQQPDGSLAVVILGDPPATPYSTCAN